MTPEQQNAFFPFEGFIEKLRENGFPVGVHTYIQVQIIVNQLGPNIPLESLKTILAPVFAKNDRDQAKFYRFFDSYFRIVDQVGQRALGQIEEEKEIVDEKPKKRRRRRNDKSIGANRWIFLLLAVLFTAFSSYLIFGGYSAFLDVGNYLEKYRLNEDRAYPYHVLRYLGNELMGQPQFCDDLENVGFTNSVNFRQGGAIEVTFINLASDTVSSRQWDFGNGQILEDTVSPVVFFGDTGKYDVSLTITNDYGCVAQSRQLISINTPKTCAVDFEYVVSDPASKQVEFRDTTVIAEDDQVKSWTWKMGDDNNTILSGGSQVFTYPEYQEYRVCLELLTENGCNDQLCRIIELKDPSTTRSLIPIEPKPALDFGIERLQTSPYARFFPFIRLALALLLFFGLLFYELYLRNRRSLSLSREKSTEGPYSWPITFPYRAEVFTEEKVHRVATHLRQRQKSEIVVLDMPLTINATLESGGFPSFRFSPGTRPSEYLILIERSNFRDHRARFFWEIVEKLREQDVYIDVYYYQSDFRMYWKELDERPVYLRELKVRHPGHRVLIFGDGEHLLDPVSGNLNGDAYEFLDWKDRAVLTPVLPSEWGLQEVRLSRNFTVLPSVMDSLSVILNEFASDVPQRLGEWKKQSYVSVPDFETDFTPDELEVYLGPDLFHWLCACAVYPELQWDLTLHLGTVIEAMNGPAGFMVNENNILKLVRIPWFRKGFIPEEMREEMISCLTEEEEMAVRAAIVQVLEQNPPPKGTFAADQYKKNLTIQHWGMQPQGFFKKRKVEEEMEELLEREEIEDVTVLKQLKAADNSMMGKIPMPDSWKNVLFREGMPILGMRSWTRMVLILPLVYILLIPVINFVSSGKLQSVKDLKQLVEKPDNIIEDNGAYYKLEDKKDSALYLGYTGLDNLNSGDFSSAYNKFAEAITLDRLNPYYYYHRGIANYLLTRNNKVDSLLLESYNDFVRANAFIPVINQNTSHQVDTSVLMPNMDMGIISPHGDVIAVSEVSHALIFDRTSMKMRWNFRHDSPVKSLSFSLDGKILAVSNGNLATLWNLTTGKKIGDLVGHEFPVNMARISPNGQYVVTGGDDNLTIVWNINNLRPIHFLEFIHSAPVLDVMFSSDNKYIVSASEDSTAAIWNRNTGEFVQYLSGHDQPVISASFSPDSRFVMTASENGTLIIWDFEGRIVARRRAFGNTIYQAMFTPDGSALVTIGDRNDGGGKEINFFDYQSSVPLMKLKVDDFQSREPTPGQISFSARDFSLLMSLKESGFVVYNITPKEFDHSLLKTYSQFNRSVLNYERENFGSAITNFSELIIKDSTDIQNVYGRGLSYLYHSVEQYLGNELDTTSLRLGMRDLQKVLTVEPAYFDSLAGLLPFLIKIYSRLERGSGDISNFCAFAEAIDPGACDLLLYDELRPYSEGLAAVRKGDQWGFIDERRNLVIPFEYYDPSPFVNHLALARSAKLNRYVIIDTSNQIVYDVVNPPSEDLQGVREFSTRKWGFIDKDANTIIIEPKYDAVDNFYRGLAKVELIRNGQTYFGFIDKTGNDDYYGGIQYTRITGNFKDVNVLVADLPGGKSTQIQYVVPGMPTTEKFNNTGEQQTGKPNDAPAPDLSLPFTLEGTLSNGLIRAKQDGKFGYVAPNSPAQQVQQQSYASTKGPAYTVVINFQYENAYDFSYERAAVKKPGGKWGFVDIYGKVVTPFEYDAVEYYTQKDENKVLALVTMGSQRFYIDRNNQCVPYLKYECPDQEARKNIGRTTYVDNSTQLVVFQEGDKWGLRTAEGRIVANPVYENQITFREGLARIRRNGKWGFIDINGREVIRPDYQDSRDFSDGLGAVKNDGKWGYINPEGRLQIGFKFDLPGQFEKGWAIVREGKISYKIDRLGNKLGDRKK